MTIRKYFSKWKEGRSIKNVVGQRSLSKRPIKEINSGGCILEEGGFGDGLT